MKKLLLAALALFGLTAPNLARAYDFTTVANPVTSLTDGGYYFIYDAHGDDGTSQEQTGGGGCRYAFRKASGDAAGSAVHGTHFKAINAWHDGANDRLDNHHVWKAIATETGAWKFQNVANDLFLTNNSQINSEDNAASLVLEATNDSFTFKVKEEGTENRRWDGNGDGNYPMVYWGGDGHPIRFYEAVETGDGYNFDETGGWNVTYTFPAHKEGATPYVTTVPVIEGEGAQYHVPAVDFFTPTALATGDAIVSATNKDFTVQGNWNFPIQANHVYRMRLRPAYLDTNPDNCKFMHFSGTEADLAYTDIDQNDFSTDFFWYFSPAGDITADGLIPVTLHGMSMTAGEGLEFEISNLKPNEDLAVGFQSSNPTVWYLRQSNVATAGQKDFMLEHSQVLPDYPDSRVYINHRNNKVATWLTNLGSARQDAGCVFRAYDLLDSDWEAIAQGDATEEEINATKADATVSNVKALIAKMSVPAADVKDIFDAADYFINDLALASEADIQEWNDWKATVTDINKVNPTRYALLNSALSTLVYNSSCHIPAEGKNIRLRHTISTGEKYMGINGSSLSANAEEGRSIFTLLPASADAGTAGFYLYNQYANKYVNFPSSLNDEPATVFILDMYSDLKNISFGIRTADGAGNIYIHNNGSNNALGASAKNEGAQWTITTATDEQAANEYLAGAKAYYNNMVTGSSTAVGQYTATEAGIAAAQSALSVDNSASVEEKRAAGDTLYGIEVSLNMPTPGRIYEFAKADKTKYLCCENRGTQRATMVDQNAQNLFSTLFYLDEDYHLVALADGTVLGCFNSGESASTQNGTWQTVLLEETEKVGVFTFGESSQRGKYTVMTHDNGNTERYLYNANADVDCGSAPNGDGYCWTIEDKGEYTPIPGTNVDHTTILLPFAMNRKAGMTLYTAKENNGKMILTEFTDQIIPGNVPFMLDLASDVQRDATNHLVYLQKAATEGNVPENNDLCGSIYAKTNTDFAIRNGNHFAPTSNEIVEGFHAHFHGPKIYTISNEAIESALDNLEGKVFALKNTDITNNRGYLIYKTDKNAIWTSGKDGKSNDAADTEAQSNSNYHWTLVKDNAGLRYLYNIDAKKFAACYTVKGENGGQCEFVWHFFDYPTAIDFCFFDYDQTQDLETAEFNIIGGEKTGTGTNATRPAGIQIINNNKTHPVVGVSGNSAKDGCGFWIKVIENATPGEVASADAALEAMASEHATAADYIAKHNDDLHPTLPGHYNAEGYAAFSAAMESDNNTNDTQAKYYQLVRARNAAGNNINEFIDGNAYEIEGMYASIYWAENQQFYVDIEENDEGSAAAYSNIWLCSKDDEGNVNFSHNFIFEEGVTGEQISKPMAVRSRAAEATGTEVSLFDDNKTPSYQDGLGNILIEGKNVKVINNAEVQKATSTATTSIAEIGANAANDTVYDLQGRRLAAPTKGFNIINGRKVIVK